LPTIDLATLTERDIAKTIDHSLLKPELDDAFVEAGCRLAAEYDVASVCVRPLDVKRAVAILDGTEVAVGTVVGFPHGSSTTATKVFEARDALANGATELDMVIPIGALRSGRDQDVRDDIAAVVQVAHEAGAIVKVILENAYLTDDEKERGSRLVEAAGADFVKTSTGFGPGGATAADVALMRRVVGVEMGVKAAGGVRDLDGLKAMVAAGATRVGASAGVKIVQESKGQKPASGAPGAY
jgi:deoxyribose-phosphate aldolase